MFVDFAANVTVPSLGGLHQVTTPTALVQTLSAKLGIVPNATEPRAGETRLSLEANIKHALFLCFQRQSEVASQTVLFYKQAEPYIPNAIKDTLPYFLGAVRADRLAKRLELRRVRQRLRNAERIAAEADLLRSRATPRALALVAEAANVGLIAKPDMETTEPLERALSILGVIAAGLQLPEIEQRRAGDGLAELRRERGILLTRLSATRRALDGARAFLRDQGGFASEAGAQKARLQAVGLFVDASAGAGAISRCPLCEQGLAAPLPAPEALTQAIVELDGQLEHVGATQPRLTEFVDAHEREIDDVQARLRENQRATSAIIAQDRALAALRDLEERQSFVRGRISGYLESVSPSEPANPEQDLVLGALRAEEAALAEELADEATDEVLRSTLNLIGRDMAAWAALLEHEYAGAPMTIDPNTLTVVADTENGPVPMQRMGSAANWVGCHVVALLGLHKWFAAKNRPVPHFLFLDQPTQVYYPPERDARGSLDGLKDEDRVAVRRLFELIFRVVKELAPGLQVIITDHAELREDWFQAALVERWRAGETEEKLIPSTWRSSQSPR